MLTYHQWASQQRAVSQEVLKISIRKMSLKIHLYITSASFNGQRVKRVQLMVRISATRFRINNMTTINSHVNDARETVLWFNNYEQIVKFNNFNQRPNTFLGKKWISNVVWYKIIYHRMEDLPPTTAPMFTISPTSWQWHENVAFWRYFVIGCPGSCHFDNFRFSQSENFVNMATSAFPNHPSGPWFNIKKSSYQYMKSRCGDKTIWILSYLHNGISYTGKATF